MKIKKLIAVLLSLVMVLALAACGNDDAKTDGGNEDTSTTTVPVGDTTAPPTVPNDSTEPVDSTEAPSIMFDYLPGSWTTALSYNGEDLGVPAFTGTLEIALVATFAKDGTYSLSVDEDAFSANIDSNKDALVAAMLQLLYDTYGGEAEAEKQVQDYMAMSCTEYAQAYVDALKDELTIDEEKGTWSAEGSNMYLDGEIIGANIKAEVMLWWGELIEEAFGVEELTFTRIAA